MTWTVLIASAGAVAWIAGLVFIVRGFSENEFRRNGFKVRVRK